MDILPTISRQNINEQVYHLILSKIVSQDFAPGQKLSIPEMARAVRVSRTPVKEAVNRLAAEGLVQINPRRGTFVQHITAQKVRELFDVRLMMETWAGELAIGLANDTEIGQLEDLLAEMSQFADGDSYTDYMGFLKVDRRFHFGLFDLAHNGLLTEMYENVDRRVQVVRAYQKAPGAAREARATQVEHRAIIDAMESRDVALLRDALREHARNRAQQYIRKLEDGQS